MIIIASVVSTCLDVYNRLAECAAGAHCSIVVCKRHMLVIRRPSVCAGAAFNLQTFLLSVLCFASKKSDHQLEFVRRFLIVRKNEHIRRDANRRINVDALAASDCERIFIRFAILKTRVYRHCTWVYARPPL